jgi:hypothetical protein
MTVRQGWLNWGVFLIALGAVPLAVYWNLVGADTAHQLVRLWPLILVAIGIGIMLRFTPLASIGGVFTAAVFGMLLGAVVAGGWTGLGNVNIACRTDEGIPVATRDGAFNGDMATLQMELNCGELTVTRSAGSTWSVTTQIAGERDPIIEATDSTLRLRNAEGLAAGVRRAWQVILPQDQAVNTNLTINAANGRLALGEGPIGALNGTFNASDVQIDVSTASSVSSVNLSYNAASGWLSLPAQPLSANVNANASDVRVCVPPEAGLLIDYDGTLSNENFASAGLARLGDDRWTIEGPQQIVLNLDVNVSSITLDRSGGCR